MNARQQITAATYGSNLLATYGFDSYGYPTSSKARVGSVYKQDYRYVFTAYTGNLYSRQNYLKGKTETFTYDNLNRLTGVTGPENLTMAYANNGNILTKTDIGTNAYTYNHATKPYALTEITTSTGLIPTAHQTATYTSFEQVKTIDENFYQADFIYNADNQRCKMNVEYAGAGDILTRWYVGSRYIKEIDEDNGITKQYTWIGGDAYTAPVVAETTGSTTTYYSLLRDYLGNITHKVNASNTLVAEYSFDAWGRRRNATNWGYLLNSNDKELVADRSFTGHEYLPWFKLINMNGRLYDPLVGRFLSPDNFVQAPGLTQSFNRYSYALNNPLVYTDPDGEFPFLAVGIFALFTYLNNAHSNRNQETGQWAWNPVSWFGKGSNATVIVGGSTNTDFTNVTGYVGAGTGPYIPAVSYNNNYGSGVGYYSPQGASFTYPGKNHNIAQEKVNQKIAEVRQNYGATWRQDEYKDVTEEFDAQLNRTMAYFSISRDWFDINYPNEGLEKEIAKMMFFKSKVTDNAVFDIKRTAFSRANLGAEYGIYRDQIFRYDDFGNYNYGVAAKYFGLSLNKALLGAGINQIFKFNPDLKNYRGYFDHRRDTRLINRGYYHKW